MKNIFKTILVASILTLASTVNAQMFETQDEFVVRGFDTNDEPQSSSADYATMGFEGVSSPSYIDTQDVAVEEPTQAAIQLMPEIATETAVEVDVEPTKEEKMFNLIDVNMDNMINRDEFYNFHRKVMERKEKSLKN